ncbi:unnamed protein product [Arctia plantaginis]|uniref:Uncharacterized protein n=1 Tax=Arctia plantaginis TaxID=874455 RepID=A0A8S0Z5T5_ARCPL|nr:unnamed protein product [Arctia plantaginis]
MYTIHEGEIVFKEKYGSVAQTRLYVKPPEQETIVTLEEQSVRDYINFFKKLFLPQGYPDSVTNDYITYQFWDTAQAFCSTITGTLATQEVLRGVGVGDTNATPLAATITWVLKDACGHLGRIMFAYSHGSYLDAYSKKWRLYADTLNDAAMCIEVALPWFKHFTTLVLCITTIMKSIVGVAGGATRAAMTQHHALRGNMADVSAKDSAQETAVNLIGSLTALLIIGMFGNSMVIFGTMIILHIMFNYFAVRAVCLRTLNEPRFLQVIDVYLKEEMLLSPCEINKNEPIVFYQMGTNILDLKLCGFKIKTGMSMKTLMDQNVKALYVKKINEVYQYREYVLFPDVARRKMYVVLRETATISDTLCAYFHAVLLSIVICAINDFPLAVHKPQNNILKPFGEVCLALQQAEWSRDETRHQNAILDQSPSIELMVYLDKIVNQEWIQMKRGLLNIGWDLSKHLLVVDEWRICTARIVTRAISVDKTANASLLPSSQVITFSESKNINIADIEERDTYTIEPETIEKSVNNTALPNMPQEIVKEGSKPRSK